MNQATITQGFSQLIAQTH